MVLDRKTRKGRPISVLTVEGNAFIVVTALSKLESVPHVKSLRHYAKKCRSKASMFRKATDNQVRSREWQRPTFDKTKRFQRQRSQHVHQVVQEEELQSDDEYVISIGSKQPNMAKS